MIEFFDLVKAIEHSGPEGKGLAELANTPVSRTLVGVLATRVNWLVTANHEADDYHLFICEDRSDYDVRLHHQFAVVCLDAGRFGDPQAMLGQLRDQLRSLDLHKQPVVMLYPGELGELWSLLDLSETVFVPVSSKEAIDILLAHPPRTPLMKRITARTPLKWLNPYVYRGPVDNRLFVGREQPLHRLCSLEASYVLVGPRSIGKTSLINRAYRQLKDSGTVAIRLEFGPFMEERELIEHFYSALVEDWGVAPSTMRRMNLPRLQRLIAKAAQRSSLKRVAVFIDEADEFDERCRRLTGMLKLLHNHGDARIVLVGYKQLRKAISDSRRSQIMNVYQELPLSRLMLRECGELIISPMTGLGVTVQDPQSVVETIYHDSGGSPSRIQLLCSAMVDWLEEKADRTITREDAERAIDLPHVRKVLADWFQQSTSIMEKYLAAVAAMFVPCDEETLIEEFQKQSPEVDVQTVRTEIQDLITADVLDYQHNGKLDFTFPLAKELAYPTGMRKSALSELRAGAVRSMRGHGEQKL